MARIQSLNMTPMEIIIALADGNPGAARVMVEMFQDGSSVDPDSALGGLGAVLSLDTHGIYGARIWMLYKDVCGQSLKNTLAVLRAVQLGIIRERDVYAAIDGAGPPEIASDALAKVKARLPRFAASDATEAA